MSASKTLPSNSDSGDKAMRSPEKLSPPRRMLLLSPCIGDTLGSAFQPFIRPPSFLQSAVYRSVHAEILCVSPSSSSSERT